MLGSGTAPATPNGVSVLGELVKGAKVPVLLDAGVTEKIPLTPKSAAVPSAALHVPALEFQATMTAENVPEVGTLVY